jgi:hypothetical protein
LFFKAGNDRAWAGIAGCHLDGLTWIWKNAAEDKLLLDTSVFQRHEATRGAPGQYFSHLLRPISLTLVTITTTRHRFCSRHTCHRQEPTEQADGAGRSGSQRWQAMQESTAMIIFQNVSQVLVSGPCAAMKCGEPGRRP